MSQNPIQLLLRNIFSNYAMMAVQIGAAFIISPILVHSLGLEQYGIWTLVFSIIAYLNFLDFGMKQSLARFLPKYYAQNDYTKLNEVFNAGNFLYGIAGTLTVFATLVIAYFFVGFINVSPEMLPVIRILLIMVGLNQAFSFFMMTGTAIGPFHRYDISNGIEIIKKIGNTLAIIYFVKAGYGLIALGIITLVTTFLNSGARRIAQHKLVPQLKYSIKAINKERLREMLGYSLYSFLIVVALLILFNASNLIIGTLISTSAVAIYSIAATLINYLRMLVSSIGVPLVPAISHLDASSDIGEIARITRKLLKYLYYLTGSICIGIFLFGSDFIYLWMGDGFEQTVNVLYILVLPACIYLPLVMTNSVFLGTGKHKTLFYIVGAEALANIILSLSLIQIWGIYGVALGAIIPQLIIYIYVYPYYYHRMINEPLKRFYKTSLESIVKAILFTLPPGLTFYYTTEINSWLEFTAVVSVVGIVTLLGFWFFILDESDRARLLSKIKI